VIPLRDNVPTRSFPVVTVGLIVVNALVWLWELSAPGVDVHVFKNGYYPCTVQGPCHIPVPVHPLPWYEGAFTSMFMHASWEHIIGNMLFLWIFGNNVEDRSGTGRCVRKHISHATQRVYVHVRPRFLQAFADPMDQDFDCIRGKVLSE
jgi:membrane associated rhomboid family serine protease